MPLALRAAILSLFFLATFLTTHTLAAEPVQLLNADTIASVEGYRGPDDTVTPVAVTGTGAPFRQALRVVRTSTGEFSYSTALIWKTRAPVKKGDLVVVAFSLRNGAANGRVLNLDVTFQLNDAPYTAALYATAPVDTAQYQKFAIPFRANQDYPAGAASLQIRYGLTPQTFDAGGISATNYGPVAQPIPASIAGTFSAYYPGRGDANAAWRKTALANIETYRKGEMTVYLRDGQGRPVSDAAVTITQTRSAFTWGTAASAISLVCKAAAGDGDRPCPTTDQLDDQPVTAADYRRLRRALLANFNGASFYNDLKWPEWNNDRQLALEAMAWMKRQGLRYSRGHNLIWPGFTPDYLMPSQLINPSTPPATARRVILAHFADILGALKGRVPEWDVVNEPYSVYDVQGRIAIPGVKPVAGKLPVSALAEWFKEARRLDPKAKLFLNDYAILENLNPTAQRYDLALVKYAKGLGAPIDGIGFQAHFNVSGPVFADMQRVINEFAPLVERFGITEFDFTSLDPKLQADLMDDFMTFVFGQPKFHSFQMWGFWDGDHWLGSGPLYNRDWTLKPSGAVWRKLTRQTWRTRATRRSSAAGEVRLKAFYGRYTVSVTANGKTCSKEVEFTRPSSFALLTAC